MRIASILRRKLSDEKKLNVWLIGSLILVLLFAFLIFYYTDIEVSTEHGIFVWKAIYNKRLFHYYEFCLENSTSQMGKWAPAYSFMMYLIFAFYNIPLTIIEFFHVGDKAALFFLLWSKSILIWFSLGTTILLEKICKLVKRENYLFGIATFVFLTSLNFFVPVLIIAQYDIIAIFFILLGIFYYLKNEDNKFMICFWIATPIKSFSLFFFIPLLLLREKRVFSILGKILAVYSYLILEPFLFVNDTAYSFTVRRMQRYGIKRLLETTLGLGENISWFILAFGIICLWCYFKPKEKITARHIVLTSMLSATTIGVFILLSSYWVVYIVPFSVLLIMTQKKYVRTGLLLEMITGVSYTIEACLTKGPYNNTYLIRRLILSRIINLPPINMLKYGSMKVLLESLNVDATTTFWTCLYVFGILAVVILYIIDLLDIQGTLMDIQGITINQLLFGRLLIVLGTVVLWVYVGVKTVPNTILSTLNYSPYVDEDSLIGRRIIQEFSTNTEETLNDLVLFFKNDSNARDNFASVSIEIFDKTDNESVFETRIGTTWIPDNKELVVPLNKVHINSNHQYYLVLMGIDTVVNGIKYNIYPYFTQEKVNYLPGLCIDGKYSDNQLYFEIR